MPKARNRLKILFVTSELAPYAKTGGLADVSASLAMELKARGHDVRIVLPYYKCVHELIPSAKPRLPSMCVRMGIGEEWASVFEATHAGDVPVYLLEHNRFFNRPGLYNDEAMNDYVDNPARFAFLCRAALQVCFDLGFQPDIIHSHDWQAALTPAYQKVWFWNSPMVGRAASVLTIHNIAYQGIYPGDTYAYTGLGADHFTEHKFEAYGSFNFLKGGLFFADVVNTVSPGHAREITTPFQGFGLAPYLSDKGERFLGILNGVDYSHWSPENGEMIPAPYSVSDLSGKTKCKKVLQKTLGLEVDTDTCLLGSIGRFADQKGFHLLQAAIGDVLKEMKVQFVVLGSGDNRLEQEFAKLPAKFPAKAGVHIGYNPELAHLIEAGADFFVMPSIFEPCGLNQLYSMRFGTPPIVRATGGLDDTVEQYNETTGNGTGFKFRAPTSGALHDTIGWAVSTYYDRPKHMKKMIRTAMKKNFSWAQSLKQYEAMYADALVAKGEYDKACSV